MIAYCPAGLPPGQVMNLLQLKPTPPHPHSSLIQISAMTLEELKGQRTFLVPTTNQETLEFLVKYILVAVHLRALLPVSVLIRDLQ